MSFLKKLSVRWLVAFIAVSTIIAAGTATILVTHTIPYIPVFNPASPVVSSTCTTLTAPSSIAQGSSGIAVFNCNNQRALTVEAAGSATPSFVLPSGYTSLSLAPFSGVTYCYGAQYRIPLTSGQPVSFPTVNLAYDYCANYTNAPSPNLASFQVTWNSS